jgi:hypothetical protein
LIFIRRGLGAEESIFTLVHEMAHAATNDSHGMRWKNEMVRLREAGAPLASSDLERLSDPASPVTREGFSAECSHVLGAQPDATLSQVVRWFISNSGSPTTTINGFKHRYPWCGGVFRNAKAKDRQRREWKAQMKAQLATLKLIPDD